MFNKTGEVAAAFEKHMEVYGGLDICINCAGITTPILFHVDKTDGSNSWRQAINVNLVGVIDCTHRAVCLSFTLQIYILFMGEYFID